MSNVYAHAYARKFLSSGKGLNFSDPQKRAVFEYCDWLVERPLDPAEATARAELDRLRGLVVAYLAAQHAYTEAVDPGFNLWSDYLDAKIALRAAVAPDGSAGPGNGLKEQK